MALKIWTHDDRMNIDKKNITTKTMAIPQDVFHNEPNNYTLFKFTNYIHHESCVCNALRVDDLN